MYSLVVQVEVLPEYLPRVLGGKWENWYNDFHSNF